MSSQALRRVLAGSLVTAFLVLHGSLSAEAADAPEAPEAQSLWNRACQWLMEQISLPEEEERAAESGSDAGWMLDPDG